MVSCVALGDRLFEFRGLASSLLFCGFLGVRGLASLALCLCPLPLCFVLACGSSMVSSVCLCS